VADNLYWMARYNERAENTARMLNVSHRMALVPQPASLQEQNIQAILIITGLQQAFMERYGRCTPSGVIRFLAFDPENPASIYSSLRAARENAHAVRGAITSEMWETLNSTWIEVRALAARHANGEGVGEFFEWVKDRSHLFNGVTRGTLLRDEAFNFITLGASLERAENTARILDVKYHVLLPSVEDVGGATDYYQWGALLRSVSAFEVYRKVYSDLITPSRVAELLILRDDLPRSLHACLNEVQETLEAIANEQSWETERRAGELHASVHYGRIENIYEVGLHEWLSDFIERLQDLGDRVAKDFMLPVEVH
jgi:uncharacterized alpha-E superfamily protein